MQNHSIYTVTKIMDTYETYELRESTTESWVRICPRRGGIVIGYGVNGVEQLYLDKESFEKPEENVVGGIPVLFPICGRLPDGKYEWSGQMYNMINHGLVRQRPWEVIGTHTGGAASITLKIASDAETREAYPFEFELIFNYSLRNGDLVIEQQYSNLSHEPMPFYAGFHPYFLASHKALAYKSDAVTMFDYNDRKESPYTGIVDLSDSVQAVVLIGTKNPVIEFAPMNDRVIQMVYEDVFQYIMLWTVKGKNFVCVEPWMAENGEFERKEELRFLDPGCSLKTSLTIRARMNCE